ncbi:MAG: site-2 protease family protein [Candidatus Parcubacteria bacterium]|nr:MAG: site-2 protease family protein [Candidatus Parcubacteria bacterium]
MEILILIIGLLISVVFHELAHGITADKLGDDTPRLAGRLTLNPISHLDPIGSILLPFLSYSLGGFIFGWAKPVPVNPLNLKNPKRDMALVALMGPITNIAIALFLLFLLKISLLINFPVNEMIILSLVRLNIVLAIFNLLPIPPLDGSRLFLSSLPLSVQFYLEQIGFFLIIIFIFFGFSIVIKVVNYLMNLLLLIFGI